MPAKIYFSDEQKRQDQLKGKGKAGNKPVPKTKVGKVAVVKSSSAARGVGGKLTERKVPAIRKTKSETSVKSSGTTAKKTGHPTAVHSGRVTIKPRASAASPAGGSLKVTLTNKRNSGNSAESTPRTARGQKSTLDNSVATARAIIANTKHPRNKDVKTLLDSYNKKFINESRFIELLKTMLF